MKGSAEFKFRDLVTGRSISILVDQSTPTIVDTIPGWIHDITNTGAEELIVLLWANEIFDRQNPDTFQASLDQ